MTTIMIGTGVFTLSGAAFGHNPPGPVTPLMAPRALSDAALRIPFRYGMGRWDCTRLAPMDVQARASAMQAFVRTAHSSHWLRHDATLRNDPSISLSDAAEAELWRRIEDTTGLDHPGLGDWMTRTFGAPRHHADLTPWLGQMMPYYSFTLHMGLVPLLIELHPADNTLPQGVSLMLSVLVDGMYHVDVTGQCMLPPQPVRQALPLRGLAGSTDDAKRWAINVARITAKHQPLLSSLLGRLRKL